MENFVNKLFDIALKDGCEAAEAYYVESDVFEAGVLNGALDTYSASHTCALNLRVQYEGKNGYACTEIMDGAESLVKRAIDNAKSIENDDEHPMWSRSEYLNVEREESPLLGMTESERIELAYEMERHVNEMGARVMMCNVMTYDGSTHIRNTKGLKADSSDSEAITYTTAVIESGGESRDGFAFRRGIAADDIKGCAEEAVEEAKSMLHAAPVHSGKYRILLRNDAAASLLESFFQMFSADAAQKGLSLLANKEGEKIGADIVTITDDPFNAYSPRSFDAEGVPSKMTSVVERGILKTLLYDLKTAKKAGVNSTGNAGRSSVFEPIAIMPTNFYIKAGTKNSGELIRDLGDGLYITEISGTHAGVNTVSGEFSLLSKGQLVKDGRIVRSVEQITISGTFLEILKNIIAIGDDIRFLMPQDGNVGSPSLLIDSVSVAGI